MASMPQHEANSVRKVAQRLVRSRRLASDLRRDGAYGGAGRPAEDTGTAPEGPRTTVDATIRPVGTGRYRRLGWAPGEPHVVRDDLGARPSPDRARSRRSLLYLAHHTDVHVCDAQAPARMVGGESFGWVNPGSDSGHRPQETCTTQVLDALVQATNAVVESPVSGATMAFCLQTGDNADNRTSAEVDWWLSVLNGRPLTPNTGLAGCYEGIQRSGWTAIWHPDRNGYDRRQAQGFPFLPGFLDAAVAPFAPVGLDVPWLAVFGNHDQIYQGSFGSDMAKPPLGRLEPMLAGGARVPATANALVRSIIHAAIVGDSPERWARFGLGPGVVTVTPDPDARRPLALEEYLGRILDVAADGPGPHGHGFGAEHLAADRSWWSRPEGDRVQVIGLDSCNHHHGDDGRIGPRQTAWLEEELQRHHRRWLDGSGRWVEGDGVDRFVIVASHHNSRTMRNHHDDDYDPGTATTGEDLVALLDRYPNVVLWLNGHSHEHRIDAHPRAGTGTGVGWWEVNTASAIDFCQQWRTVELFDNGDGTLSILATVLDHLVEPCVPHDHPDGWTPARLASMSRELAANDDRWFDPMDQLGRLQDRNVELPLAMPFGR
jgi:metallophosphoesterase (TIGR03767 family)